MARRLPDDLTPELIAQARENISSELAWQHPAILEVVAALAEQGYAILGGDVMHAAAGEVLDYYRDGVYCGNWYLNREREQSWAEYISASVATTRRYIEAYVRKNGDAYWFVPVFVDEQGFAELPQRNP